MAIHISSVLYISAEIIIDKTRQRQQRQRRQTDKTIALPLTAHARAG